MPSPSTPFHKIHLEIELSNSKEGIIPCVNMLCAPLLIILPTPQVLPIKLALQEALANAIEHGNLEISKAEKSAALKNDTFEALVKTRQQATTKEERKVHITMELTKSQCSFVVEDEGRGFDWRGELKSLPTETSLEELHGRGLTLITAAFDETHFNEQGNIITMTKRFF